MVPRFFVRAKTGFQIFRVTQYIDLDVKGSGVAQPSTNVTIMRGIRRSQTNFFFPGPFNDSSLCGVPCLSAPFLSRSRSDDFRIPSAGSPAAGIVWAARGSCGLNVTAHRLMLDPSTQKRNPVNVRRAVQAVLLASPPLFLVADNETD